MQYEEIFSSIVDVIVNYTSDFPIYETSNQEAPIWHNDFFLLSNPWGKKIIIRPEQIRPETRLIQDFGLNPVDLLFIIMTIENRWNISELFCHNDEEVCKAIAKLGDPTVADIAARLEQKLAE